LSEGIVIDMMTLCCSTSLTYGLPVIRGASIGLLLRLLYRPLQASVVRVNDNGLAIGILLTFQLLGSLWGN